MACQVISPSPHLVTCKWSHLGCFLSPRPPSAFLSGDLVAMVSMLWGPSPHHPPCWPLVWTWLPWWFLVNVVFLLKVKVLLGITLRCRHIDNMFHPRFIFMASFLRNDSVSNDPSLLQTLGIEPSTFQITVWSYPFTLLIAFDATAWIGSNAYLYLSNPGLQNMSKLKGLNERFPKEGPES